MISRFPRAPLAALAVFAASALFATTAGAQGTDEQQQACAPDAFKLCQNTIPDIPKTTACMKAHFAELSPRCKVAFNAVTGTPRPSRRQEAVVPPAPAAPDVAAEAAPGSVTGGIMSGYEEQIRGYCRDGLIDPFTCRNTLAALHGMQ